MPKAVVRNSLEEDADVDAWVDMDVDKDDVVLNSAQRNMFA